MGVLGNPWEDIDRTKRNTPYIVDESGWGWFALFFIALVPFALAFLLLQKIALFVTHNLIISSIIFLIITIIIGKITYKSKGFKKCLGGVIATILTFTPVALIEFFFEIPMIVTKLETQMVDTVIEWFFVTLFVVGISIFIQAINLISVSFKRHILIAAIYFAIVIMIITKVITIEEFEAIKNLYN